MRNFDDNLLNNMEQEKINIFIPILFFIKLRNHDKKKQDMIF